MGFSTLVFLFRFIPIFLIIYYIVPVQYKNQILFLGSIIFYAFGEPVYILLLLFSILVNYFAAFRLEALLGKVMKRRILLCALLVYNVGILLFLKYVGGSIPLGISFYTFTIISYSLDVYMQQQQPEHSFWKLGTFMLMFPKLISGPIVTYKSMNAEIIERKVTAYEVEEGFMLFVIGLGYKVIIANHLSILWHDIQGIGFDSISTPLAWMGALGYSTQLFFDFQGYSLMAIGLGRMLGFHLPENFKHPYRSKSISEFYRRWHITLGQWFKNYLYIPLGGNRKGKVRMIVNLFIVWLITGIWHGVSWNFLLWGMVIFGLIILEKIFLKKYLDKSKVLVRIYILLIIPLTWVIFAIDKLSLLGIYFSRLFPLFHSGICVNQVDYVKYVKNCGLFFGLAVIVSLPIADKLYMKYKDGVICKIILFLVFWVSVYMIVTGLNNPFLYFRF